jgi:phage tail-like protein
MSQTDVREDPWRAFNFIVDIDGIGPTGFSEAAGLSQDSAVIEYRNSDDPLTMRKLSGLHRFPVITLRRGYTTSRALWDWRRAILAGRHDRRNGSITLRDEEGRPVMEWQFENGWISRYEGPTLNARGDEVAIEAVDITHEGLRLA